MSCYLVSPWVILCHPEHIRRRVRRTSKTWFSPNSTEGVNSFHSRAEKNLPKQKTRPKRSNYTWGGGGRGEEEKKTSITEPDPSGRRRRMEEAGSSLQTPSLGRSPHPQLGNIDLYRAPEPWAMWNTFCASAIELIPLEELKLLSPLLSPPEPRSPVGISLARRESQLGECVWHTCCCHSYRNPQSTWKAKKKIPCVADTNDSPSINIHQ